MKGTIGSKGRWNDQKATVKTICVWRSRHRREERGKEHADVSQGTSRMTDEGVTVERGEWVRHRVGNTRESTTTRRRDGGADRSATTATTNPARRPKRR